MEQSINKNHQNNDSKSFPSIKFDEKTPYFRKSISYQVRKEDIDIEKRINDYLDFKGVFFIESSYEAIQETRKQSITKDLMKSDNLSLLLSDTDSSERSRTSLSLNENSLFLKRKILSLNRG